MSEEVFNEVQDLRKQMASNLKKLKPNTANSGSISEIANIYFQLLDKEKAIISEMNAEIEHQKILAERRASREPAF